MKLVDAVDSKSTVRNDVSVRVRPSGPLLKLINIIKFPNFITTRNNHAKNSVELYVFNFNRILYIYKKPDLNGQAFNLWDYLIYYFE